MSGEDRILIGARVAARGVVHLLRAATSERLCPPLGAEVLPALVSGPSSGLQVELLCRRSARTLLSPTPILIRAGDPGLCRSCASAVVSVVS